MTGRTVAELLAHWSSLSGVSDTARLDTELLLGHVLGRDRTWLMTWHDRVVSPAEEARFLALLVRRKAGEPVAHLMGTRDFWTLTLTVAPDTLIPRPDTELLVEVALACLPNEPRQVLDLGTGTGAVALALASERRAWQLVAVDRVPEAVGLAEANRKRCGFTNVSVRLGHWFASLAAERFHLIVSNPPYLAATDPHLGAGDVRFEPASALVSGPTGLEDLAHIIQAAPAYLMPGGWLLLEHGAEQGEPVRELLCQAGFADVGSHRDLGGRERVSGGVWTGASEPS